MLIIKLNNSGLKIKCVSCSFLCNTQNLVYMHLINKSIKKHPSNCQKYNFYYDLTHEIKCNEITQANKYTKAFGEPRLLAIEDKILLYAEKVL